MQVIPQSDPLMLGVKVVYIQLIVMHTCNYVHAGIYIAIAICMHGHGSCLLQ